MQTAAALGPLTAEALRREKTRLLGETRAGASLPAAGAIYWGALAALGWGLDDPYRWSLAAAFGSGLLFPLGLLLQKPLGARIVGGVSPISTVALMAVVGINLLWPLYFALIFARAFDFLPLALALGMTMHWPVIGWMYGSRVCLAHALVRAVVVTAIWFALPEARFTLLPLSVAVIYAATVIALFAEAKAARRTYANAPNAFA